MGKDADANMFHSKKLPFLCVRIASIMADLPRGFNDDFSSFARGGSDGVKNTKKQHGLLTSDGQKTVLLCCLVRAWGLEPQRLAAREPKSRMSANSIMPANRTTIAQLVSRGKEKNRKTVWEDLKRADKRRRLSAHILFT